MPYLNLDVNYFNHIKTVRLVGLLGRGAAELPLRLWAHCGANIAKVGSLAGYSAQEIEALVGWWGRGGEAVEAMVKVGFLEKSDDGYAVHDWDEHEGHLISFHERAKEGAKERWKRYRNASSIASSIAKPPDKQCSSRTIPAVPNQPNHNTAPLAQTKRFAKPTPGEVTAYAASIGFKLDGERFCAFYESKGWVIGKSPMRSWKAAVVTWKKDAHVSAMILPPKPRVIESEPSEEERLELLGIIAMAKAKAVPR